MRPEILNSLFQNLESIEKVGDKTAKALQNLLDSPYIVSLLWHLPTSVINRRFFDNANEAFEYAILKLRVMGHDKGKTIYKVICEDDYGNEIILSFFHGKGEYLKNLLPINEYRYISGKIEVFKGVKQISHPDYINKVLENIPVFEPIYPMCAGISKKLIRYVTETAIKMTPALPEWISSDLLNTEKWIGFNQSLISAHSPKKIDDINHFNKDRRRLAYDELLSNQLALAILRKRTRHLKGKQINTAINLHNKLRDILPFKLTNAQEKAINEINLDMAKSDRMIRLLQGDVGSGKTLVAFFAMLNAINDGYQTAIMAPTDILARQHAKTISDLAKTLGFEVVLITASLNAKEKALALLKTKEGKAKIIIGTHALFQDSIEFKNLGLVVIDEQHRFGVNQRLRLTEKGSSVDMLVMSATPIPRTLALTIYGDMDLSILDEKPVGRKDILTCAINNKRIDDVIDGLKRAINDDKQIYWVCPLVEETEKSDLKAVSERYAVLNTIFAGKVGMVHGRMKSDEKEKALNDFATGKTKILVATTVIEVGIDVKDATIIIIEHAERFGLSALHQLRGRVGRNDMDSSCILLYSDNLSEIAKERINVLRSTNDGFKIAEADLKIRGQGDALGTKQSGIADFKLADLNFDRDLLLIAARDANIIIQSDPMLESERGKALRILLYLMGQDMAITNLLSG